VHGKPFTQFWFDDNWLARYMSTAYGQQLPNGLSKYSDMTRWQILGGDGTNWNRYGATAIDQLALDGLDYLATGDVVSALAKMDAITNDPKVVYDGMNQRYSYGNITENYHLGLAKILADNLLANSSLDPARRSALLQHSISLRSNILSNQETNGINLYGWVTGINDPTTLMNIESIACNVLALGATTNTVFEAGLPPLTADNNQYFLRPHHVLSGVTGLSQAGFMTRGPGWTIPTGTYQVDFFLRAPSPVGKMATVDVRDTISGNVLVSGDVNAADMASGNTWTQITLPVFVTSANTQIELRTYWYATANMDVAAIRIR
jgi:hypothetical protein